MCAPLPGVIVRSEIPSFLIVIAAYTEGIVCAPVTIDTEKISYLNDFY